MAETLLSVSEVLLYGRVMDDLQFCYQEPAVDLPKEGTDGPPPRPGRKVGLNSMMQNQLAASRNGEQGANPDLEGRFAPKFARIYGFSFEGGYYDLDAPIIMLVHGPGVPAESKAGDPRASRSPDTPDKTGAAASGHSFADDIKVWSYDKADFTVRMDTLSGTLEDILLDVELGGGAHVSGGRVSGGRVSGGRVSGGRVSGGRVSGGRVSGGRVSGGRVSGGKDD